MLHSTYYIHKKEQESWVKAYIVHLLQIKLVSVQVLVSAHTSKHNTVLNTAILADGIIMQLIINSTGTYEINTCIKIC